VAAHRTDVDFLSGFSLGGRVVADWLVYQANMRYFHIDDSVFIGSQIRSVLLIHPFMNSVFMAGAVNVGGVIVDFVQLKNLDLYASTLPGVHVVIRNDSQDVYSYGKVLEGGDQLTSNGACPGFPHHCSNERTAAEDVDTALR
jgi:hypothetical protein